MKLQSKCSLTELKRIDVFMLQNIYTNVCRTEQMVVTSRLSSVLWDVKTTEEEQMNLQLMNGSVSCQHAATCSAFLT